MKYSPRFTYTFTPSSNTLDLSSANNAGFSIRGLLAVIDVDKNVLIYATSSAGLGYSTLSGGNVLTLQYNCSALSASDNLIFFYDDGNNSQVAGNNVVTDSRPDGYMSVRQDPSTILYDPFVTLDTTNNWTTGGTVAPVIAAGALTFPVSTTASATSYLLSKAAVMPGTSAYLQYGCVLQIETAAIANNKRFWGLGVISTPTLTVPITNGVIFETDPTAGALYASTYSNGARVQQATITRPSDGANHRYQVYYKASHVYFEVDGVVVANFLFPNPYNGILSAVSGSINNSTAPSAAPVLNLGSCGIGDTSKGSVQLADGAYPWREATVKPGSTSAVSTDTALVTIAHPLGVQLTTGTISPASGGTGVSPVLGGGLDPSGLVRTTALSSTGNVFIQGAPQTTFTGSITSATAVVGGTQDLSTAGNCTVVVSGTHTGVTLVFEASADTGSNWFAIQGQRTDSGNVENTSNLLTSNQVRAWNFSLLGINRFRVRATTWTSGSASILVDPGTGWFVPVVGAVIQEPVRTSFKMYAENVTATTTETMVSFITSTGFATGATAATSFAVPNTRTYRITQISVTLVSGSTVANTTRLRLRVSNTGATITTSTGSIQWSTRVGLGSATFISGQAQSQVFMFPDGIDIPATYSFGISHLELSATGGVDVDVVGYYY